MTGFLSTDDEKAFFLSRGFGRPIGFGKRPVILVIDLVNAFTDATKPLGAPLEAQIDSTNQLLQAARQASLPVIFSTVSYGDVNLRDAGIWALKQGGIGSLAANTDGPTLDPRLRKLPGDQLLAKKYASCFFGTDLVSRLNACRADTVIITGCTTSGCVRATAVDACQNGYRPMVVREAVGDRSQRAHEQSLLDLDAKYADVVSLSDTESFIASLSREAE